MVQLVAIAAPRTGVSPARRPLVPLAAVLGACAVLISTLGSWIPSLWGDEAASLLSAERPLPSLFMMLRNVDAVHGFYYVLLHFWIRVAGTSPFALRLPSALAVGVAVAAVVWICGRLHSVRFAIVAGAIAAVLPRLTDVGEEARPYAFDAALCAILVAIVVELVLLHASRWLWIAYGAVLAVATYMFLYDVLMVVAIGWFLLARPTTRAHLRPWAIATACAIVVSSPVMVFALLERAQVSYLAHRSVVTPDAVFVQMWFWTVPVAVVAWALIALAIVPAAGRALRRRAQAGTPSGPAAATRTVGGPADSAMNDILLLATCWLVLPVGILLAVSPLIADYTARYGAFAAPAAAILMAAGILQLTKLRWAPTIAATALAVTLVPVWVQQRGPYAMNGSDWNEIAATISTHSRPGDGIVFDDGAHPSKRTRLAMDTDPSAFTNVKDVTLKTPYPLDKSWHDSAYAVEAAGDLGRFHGIERVWVVEYSIGAHTDQWGVPALEAMGFHESASYQNHRSVAYLFTR